MNQALDIISVGKLLHVKVTGKLTKDSYEAFAPLVNEQIEEHGKVRIMFEMHDFHGWTAGALWEDLKFDFKHWKDIERLAIVGKSKWEAAWPSFANHSRLPRSNTSIMPSWMKQRLGSQRTS